MREDFIPSIEIGQFKIAPLDHEKLAAVSQGRHWYNQYTHDQLNLPNNFGTHVTVRDLDGRRLKFWMSYSVLIILIHEIALMQKSGLVFAKPGSVPVEYIGTVPQHEGHWLDNVSSDFGGYLVLDFNTPEDSGFEILTGYLAMPPAISATFQNALIRRARVLENEMFLEANDEFAGWPDFLTRKEATFFLGVSERTLAVWEKDHPRSKARLVAHKHKGVVRYTKAAVAELCVRAFYPERERAAFYITNLS